MVNLHPFPMIYANGPMYQKTRFTTGKNGKGDMPVGDVPEELMTVCVATRETRADARANR